MVSHKQTRHSSTTPPLFGWIVVAFILFSSQMVGAEVPNTTVFLEPSNNEESLLEPVNENIIIRQRPVQIEPEAVNSEFDTLYLNLFDDIYITALRDHVEQNELASFTWIGSVEGYENSEVTLVLSEDGERLSGAIKFSDYYFHIRPLDSGIHVIREIDSSFFANAEDEASPAGEDSADFAANRSIAADTYVSEERLAAETASILAPFEQQVFDLVNQERAIANVHALAADSQLTAAARGHSQDMAQQNYFSHGSLDGRSPSRRIRDAGYPLGASGENIAAGQRSAQSVMNDWMSSTGHRSNILNSLFCDIGVGYATGGQYGHYWTQNFGRKSGVSQCSSNPTPTPTPPAEPTPPSSPTIPTPPPSEPTPQPEPEPQPDQPGELKNGVAQSFQLSRNATREYIVRIPENARNFKVAMSGSGDADVYVKRTSVNWPQDAGRNNTPELKSPWLSSANETVVFSEPRSGTWHILVHGYTASQGSIVATFDIANPDDDSGNNPGGDNPGDGDTDGNNAIPLQIGSAQNFSVSGDQVVRYTITVPANKRILAVYTAGNGDADLYAKKGAIAWPADKGRHNESGFHSSLRSGSWEQVWFLNPTGGTWNILVHGKRASSGRIIAVVQ